MANTNKLIISGLLLCAAAFGQIVADGVTDDTAALQAAVDLCGVSKSCTAMLPVGNVLISRSIKFRRDGAGIIGQGPGVANGGRRTLAGSTLVLSPGFIGPAIDVDPSLLKEITGQSQQWIYGITMRDFAIDAMASPSVSPVIRIMSGSNFPIWSNVSVMGYTGTCLYVGRQAAVPYAISEGLVFQNFYCYGGGNWWTDLGPPTAPAVVLHGVNETAFRDGKIIYARYSRSPYPAVRIESDEPAVIGSNGILFDGVSTASYETHYEATDFWYSGWGCWMSPNYVRWQNSTMEAFSTGIRFRTTPRTGQVCPSYGIVVDATNRFLSPIGSGFMLVTADKLDGGNIELNSDMGWIPNPLITLGASTMDVSASHNNNSRNVQSLGRNKLRQ